MTLKDFSSGYYSMDMQVQPYEDGPVIAAPVYDYINREVYSNTNAPVTMKLSLDNGAYFNVGAENAVPHNVLALPDAWVENFVERQPQTVFVLKPGHSYMMHQGGILEEQIRDTALEEFTDE